MCYLQLFLAQLIDIKLIFVKRAKILSIMNEYVKMATLQVTENMCIKTLYLNAFKVHWFNVITRNLRV